MLPHLCLCCSDLRCDGAEEFDLAAEHVRLVNRLQVILHLALELGTELTLRLAEVAIAAADGRHERTLTHGAAWGQRLHRWLLLHHRLLLRGRIGHACAGNLLLLWILLHWLLLLPCLLRKRAWSGEYEQQRQQRCGEADESRRAWRTPANHLWLTAGDCEVEERGECDKRWVRGGWMSE